MAGRDLTAEPIEVVPTGHFHMGGARIDLDGRTSLQGLWIAGEDAGGVHGANRLGGNGVAESTVFGARAGRSMVEDATLNRMPEVDQSETQEFVGLAETRLGEPGKSANPYRLRQRVEDAMWEGAGVIRDAAGLMEGAPDPRVGESRTRRYPIGGLACVQPHVERGPEPGQRHCRGRVVVCQRLGPNGESRRPLPLRFPQEERRRLAAQRRRVTSGGRHDRH